MNNDNKILITKPQLKSYLQSTCCYKNLINSSKHYLQFQKKETIQLQILKNRSNLTLHKRGGNRYN